MANRKRALRVVLVVGAVGLAVAGVAVAVRLRQHRELAAETADAIRSQLDDLDPVTRAMVRENLAEDAVAEVRERHQ
jgi:hypothetical protein